MSGIRRRSNAWGIGITDNVSGSLSFLIEDHGHGVSVVDGGVELAVAPVRRCGGPTRFGVSSQNHPITLYSKS